MPQIAKTNTERASVVHFDHDACLFAQVPMAQKIRSCTGPEHRKDVDEKPNFIHGVRRSAIRSQRRRGHEEVAQSLKGKVAAHYVGERDERAGVRKKKKERKRGTGEERQSLRNNKEEWKRGIEEEREKT